MIIWREPVPETPREFSGLRMTRLTNRMQEPRPPAWLGWIGWAVVSIFASAALWTFVRALQNAIDIARMAGR
jgi:hypothetical protein